MSYEWIEAYNLKKKAVVYEYKEEWGAWRYMVGGKMFAMQGGDKEGRPILTIKLAPSHGDFLRQQYPGKIVPGYYMNKEHWNSLYLSSDVPDAVVRDMLDEAYLLIWDGLPKKIRGQLE